MQFSTVAAISALAAVASATYPVSNGTVVYTTEVFTAYTTYCPASTELTYAGITYTATEVSISRWRRDQTRSRSIDEIETDII